MMMEPPPDTPSAAASLRHTLSKRERLYLRADVQALFQQGKGFHQQEFRVICRLVPAAAQTKGQAAVQILVSAPKKHFRRAHDRNRVKRLLREAYRQHKHALLAVATQAGLYVHIAFILNNRAIPPYPVVVDRVQQALHRISKIVQGASAQA